MNLSEQSFQSLESRSGFNLSLLPVAATVSDHRQNHRFLRAQQEGEQKLWWLFDHLNSLVSAGSGACEKVGGQQSDDGEGQKVEETENIRRHTKFQLEVTKYFTEICPHVCVAELMAADMRHLLGSRWPRSHLCYLLRILSHARTKCKFVAVICILWKLTTYLSGLLLSKHTRHPGRKVLSLGVLAGVACWLPSQANPLPLGPTLSLLNTYNCGQRQNSQCQPKKSPKLQWWTPNFWKTLDLRMSINTWEQRWRGGHQSSVLKIETEVVNYHHLHI